MKCRDLENYNYNNENIDALNILIDELGGRNKLKTR